MSNSFEQKLINTVRLSPETIDTKSFLADLHQNRKNKRLKKNRLIYSLSAALFLMVLGGLTFIQLDSTMGYDNNWAEIEEADYFDMDFWNNQNEIELKISENYYNELAILLLEEDEFWNTIKFLDDMNYTTSRKEL